MEVGSRRCKATDLEWLDGGYAAAMRPSLEAVGEWDATAFRATFDPVFTSVIQADGVDVGMLRIEQKFDGLLLRSLWIAPAFQGQGIGARVLRGIVEKAQRECQPARTQVPRGSRCLVLLERLGFKVAAVQGNWLALERRPELDDYLDSM